jgi:hypothetical protein
MLLAALTAAAQAATVDCRSIPAGPERTDCYLALSRYHREQGDLAAAEALAKADAAWYRAITGEEPPPIRRTRPPARR